MRLRSSLFLAITMAVLTGCSAIVRQFEGRDRAKDRNSSRTSHPLPRPRRESDPVTRERILASLKSSHPRLIASEEDFRSASDLIASRDDLAMHWHDLLRAEAEKLLSAKPATPSKPKLNDSREA